ncbi:Hypothetical_protein [Hexamita inflata]|uniref:Hypothetical_protein n=1 Tax=Hexamita inflata TaxID=28002 RepID=A0AA86NPE0_9EUKA|nr:Hypothetical protein HINF_LOCUS10241 [Hexamita inflata]
MILLKTCFQRGKSLIFLPGFELGGLKSRVGFDFRQGKYRSEKIKGRERSKAAERERGRRTREELVGKIKAASALRSSRQLNSLAFSCLPEYNPAEIQLSLAFWRICSKSAPKELKVHFPYQDSRPKPGIGSEF